MALPNNTAIWLVLLGILWKLTWVDLPKELTIVISIISWIAIAYSD